MIDRRESSDGIKFKLYALESGLRVYKILSRFPAGCTNKSEVIASQRKFSLNL